MTIVKKLAAEAAEPDLADVEPGSSFGTTQAGGAGDPRSSYAATGANWFDSALSSLSDGLGSPEDQNPLSFDVSNGSIAAAIDSDGYLRRLAVSCGVESAHGGALPGVYATKKLILFHGRGGFELDDDLTWCRRTVLLDNLLPRTVAISGGLQATVTYAAPIRETESSPRAIVVSLLLENRSCERTALRLRMLEGGAFVKVVAPEMLNQPLVVAEGHGLPSDGVVDVEGGSAFQCSAIYVLTEDETEAAEVLAELRSKPAAEWIEDTRSYLRARYGRLRIRGGQYYADLLERQAELARQVWMRDREGRPAGSFWGSDPNARADIWFRDLFYSALPMAELHPENCRHIMSFLAEWGMPTTLWEDEAAAPPEVDSVCHSVGNATAAVALAGAYYEATADASFIVSSGVYDYGVRLLEGLERSRRPGDRLFRSLYISDGPSRGDFHTGSNILAWYGHAVMSRLAKEVGDPARATIWANRAEEIRLAVHEICASDGMLGRELFEGAWKDGSLVVGHDGEESDLTLAARYGFAAIDELPIVNHAKRAFSGANPYYSPAVRGVEWWDGCFYGATFPAFIHALAGASDEEQLLAALEQIRQRVDLDGSVWWWPHSHGASDQYRVRRYPGKCGWAAGLFVAKFMREVLGLVYDAPTRCLRVRPFSPWSRYSWQGARIGKAIFDVEHVVGTRNAQLGVTNRGQETMIVQLEILLKDDFQPARYLLNGSDAREEIHLAMRFGRPGLSVWKSIEPGESATFCINSARA